MNGLRGKVEEQRQQKSWLHRNWRLLVGLLASLGCLIWVVPSADWMEVGRTLKQVTWLQLPWLLAGVGAILLSTLTRAWRWSALLLPKRLPFRNLLTSMLVGQTLNYFAPARAGDLARAYWLGDRVNRLSAHALGTIIVEKLCDLLVVLLVLALLPLWIDFPDWLIMPAYGLALLSLSLLLFILLGLIFRAPLLRFIEHLSGWLPDRWEERIAQLLIALLDGLESLRRRGSLWRVCLGTAIVWTWGAVAHLAVFWTLEMHTSITMLLFLSAVLRAGIAVPAMPGSIGVYEGITVACLAVFGIDTEAALSYGLLMHLVDFGPPILLTAGLVWIDHRIKESSR
ncbi:MAG: lysylphosphatidylglycerol synthase transmembrane domain-containing protein [Planctomycetota bacterium]